MKNQAPAYRQDGNTPTDAKRIPRDSRLYREGSSRIELLFPAIIDASNLAQPVRPLFGTIISATRQRIEKVGDSISFVYVSPGTDANNGGEFAAPFFRLFKNAVQLTDWLPCAFYSSQYDFSPVSPLGAATQTQGANQIALPQTMPRYEISFTAVELWNPRATSVNVQALICLGSARAYMMGG